MSACRNCNGLGYVVDPTLGADGEGGPAVVCDSCKTTGGFCGNCGEPSGTNLCGSCEEQRIFQRVCGDCGAVLPGDQPCVRCDWPSEPPEGRTRGGK